MTRSQIPGPWQYGGLNVGVDIARGAPFVLATVQADAEYHKKVGIPSVRVAGSAFHLQFPGTYGNTLFANLHTMVQIYLALGIEVQYIIPWYSTFSTSNEAAFEAFLSQEAAWAQSVGVQKIQIMNEQEININGTFSQASIYAYQQTLPAIARTAGFTGIISTSVSQDHFGSWAIDHSYDQVGLDIYGSGTADGTGLGNFNNFKSQIGSFITQVGASKAIVSEWACQADAANLYEIDSVEYSKAMIKRRNFLQNTFTKTCYMFTWKYFDSNYPGTDYWSACTQLGQLRYFWYEVMNIRNPLY